MKCSNVLWYYHYFNNAKWKHYFSWWLGIKNINNTRTEPLEFLTLNFLPFSNPTSPHVNFPLLKVNSAIPSATFPIYSLLLGKQISSLSELLLEMKTSHMEWNPVNRVDNLTQSFCDWPKSLIHISGHVRLIDLIHFVKHLNNYGKNDSRYFICITPEWSLKSRAY